MIVNKPQFDVNALQLGRAIRAYKKKECDTIYGLILHVTPLKIVILYLDKKRNTENLTIPIEEVENYELKILGGNESESIQQCN